MRVGLRGGRSVRPGLITSLVLRNNATRFDYLIFPSFLLPPQLPLDLALQLGNLTAAEDIFDFIDPDSIDQRIFASKGTCFF